MDKSKLVHLCPPPLPAGCRIDQECVAGWASIQFPSQDNSVHVRLCFMLDGTVKWDRNTLPWMENGSEISADTDRKLDD